jgi:hypothetical protein
VRAADYRETLGVMLNGETLFDKEDISKASAEVIARDAIWRF